jgi:hypothetical protein
MEVSYNELELFLREQIGRVFETCDNASCPVACFVRTIRPECAVTVSAKQTRLVTYDGAKAEIQCEPNPRWLSEFIRLVDRSAMRIEAGYEDERNRPGVITAATALELLELCRPE